MVQKDSQKKKNIPKNKDKITTELSIIEHAKHEKEMSRSDFANHDGKKYTREVFKLWLVMPDNFKGAPERITQLLGISDDTTLELLNIKSMQQFALEFGVHPPTLSRWRKEFEDGDDFMLEVRRQMKTLTKNFMGALYRKGIEEGDAARFMAWMKVVEGWREQVGIVQETRIEMSAERKAQLDQLIEENDYHNYTSKEMQTTEKNIRGISCDR